MLKYIIGFRTEKLENMFIASVYYLGTFIFAFFSGSFPFTLALLWGIPFVIYPIKELLCGECKLLEALISMLSAIVLVILSALITPSHFEPKRIVLQQKEIVFSDINVKQDFSFTVDPAKSNRDNLKVIIRNPTIASFEDGVLTSLNEGETIIYVKCSANDVESERIKIFVTDKKKQKARESESQRIIEVINSIDDTDILSRESALQQANSLYDKASNDIKALVTNKDILNSLNEKYSAALAETSKTVDTTVYIGNSGTKYHEQSCRSLKGKGHAVSLSEALSQGKTACKICH